MTVEGFLNEAQLKVSSGEEESMVSHQKTMLDDTLICFRRIDTFLDAGSGKIIKHEKPVLIGAEVSFSSLMKRLLRQFNGTAAYDLMFTFLLTVLIFAESNPNGLFITTFVAVFDPKTGELTYSNSGHNRPYVISDSLITLDGAAGMAAGIFAGFEYEQETVALKQNDVVFLYTDGVNEAESTSGEQFGTEALENRLEEHIGLQSDNVSGDIFKTIEEFSDGAVQSDDITILTLKVKQLPSYREITVRNHPENLTELNDMINGELRISDEIKAQLLLIAEELFVNICSYAYGGKEGDITVAFETDAENVTLTFTDSGKPFDPTANVVDINDYDHENSIGGLGCFLAFELSDVYSYSYLDGKNILKITKRL